MKNRLFLIVFQGVFGFSIFYIIHHAWHLGATFAAILTFATVVLVALFFEKRDSLIRADTVEHYSQLLRRESYGGNSRPPTRSLDPDLDELFFEARGIIQQLSTRLTSVLRKKEESDAALASMMEGVIAVDSEGRILTANEAAQKLLNISVVPHTNPNINLVIQNPEFLELIRRILDTHQTVEEEIRLSHKDGAILQVKGSPLLENNRGSIGAVLVFHDTSQLRKLETIRQDFDANVSHELKTPITSIKGFVETLLDGALNDREDAERFLHIVSKQADRLTAIIEDLLALSRLEQEDSSQEIAKEYVSIQELVERSCQACQLKGEEKELSFIRDLEEGMVLYVNPHLIEQALVNLISNAIKYSHERGKIILRAQSNGEDVTISVRDYGVGIPSKDLSRVFERFYRVDRARSRKMGGTGLGLAIVKHIAQAHDGSVSVESGVNQGSTFYIHLPSAVTKTSHVRNLNQLVSNA